MLAINGWSLKARTLQDVAEMIAVSRRHLTLRIEFDVAGLSLLFFPALSSLIIIITFIHTYTVDTEIYNVQRSQACSSNQRRRQSLGGGC